MKTSENDAKYSSLNIGEMDKSRELYSKEGDNSSRFEEKNSAVGTHYRENLRKMFPLWQKQLHKFSLELSFFIQNTF